MARIDAAQQQYQAYKEKYERLRSDVTIKLKFLEENKVSLWGRCLLSLSSRWGDHYTSRLMLSLWLTSVFFLQVKVMHKQLLLFHNAISAYFAGNQQQLEQTLQQFNIKLKPPGCDKPSWLEEQWEGSSEAPAASSSTTTSNCSLLKPPTYSGPLQRDAYWFGEWRCDWMTGRWIAGYYWWMGLMQQQSGQFRGQSGGF